MSSRIVITGGSGFLGSLLARRLLREPVALGGAEPADVTELVLVDLVAPADDLRADGRVRCLTGALGSRARRPGRGRRRVPPRRGGERRRRGGLRPGHGHEHRRDADGAGVRPTARRSAAGRVLQLAGGVRQRPRDRARRGRRRRHPPAAADQLRDPEVHRRAAGGRLHAQGLRARPFGPADDRVRAARTPQRGGVGLPVRDHPRTPRRRARALPGRPGHPGGAVVPPAHPRGAAARGRGRRPHVGQPDRPDAARPHDHPPGDGPGPRPGRRRRHRAG